MITFEIWETWKLQREHCPVCGTHYRGELIELIGIVSQGNEDLPIESFYQVVCPNDECTFNEYIAVLRDPYLSGLNRKHEALQSLQYFVKQAPMRCATCRKPVGEWEIADQDPPRQRFYIRVDCPGCEQSLAFHFSWKIINLPRLLDPVLRARQLLRTTETVPQLLALMKERR